jgi:hypothetical protein
MNTLVPAADRRPLEPSTGTSGATRGLGALLIADALLSFAPVATVTAVSPRQVGASGPGSRLPSDWSSVTATRARWRG